jgi:hypothetical protein
MTGGAYEFFAFFWIASELCDNDEIFGFVDCK